jgi:adenylosuccinate lyase
MATQIKETSALTALSPLDGRYAQAVHALSDYFSEFALIRYRVMVEVEYLIAFLGAVHGDLSRFGPDTFRRLKDLYESFGVDEAAEVKRHEKTTNHDVKAVEYFLKDRLRALPELADELEKIHFGLTSEDVNNLAYACMVKEATRDVLLPTLMEAFQLLRDLASRTKEVPMLARTHGQPASPTTMGKELAVFLNRLAPELEGLHTFPLTGKLNGATGTFGALAIAYPDLDWIHFSASFIQRLGLVPNLVTTQIEPHDRFAALCDRIRLVNNILFDLDQDLWHYISHGYFRQQLVTGEVGSSTMPHKVNPIDFENSEGNLGLANALFAFFSEKLTKSRMQRDLTDSTVQRNIGSAFGYSLMAYKSTIKGLRKLELAPERLSDDLRKHPEVLAEAYQTVLRAEGHELPYERLKELTRGERVTLDQMRAFVETLDLSPRAKERLVALTPDTYIGLAPQVADVALGVADRLLLNLRAAE